MKPPAKPGFLLVARREWRWLLHDRAALILIFGVPIFAFAVLSAAFSRPVIRGLGVVVVDADRSETSRAFVEEVAASPGLSIAERAGDLASAARAIRSGEAISAVYLPADFELAPDIPSRWRHRRAHKGPSARPRCSGPWPCVGRGQGAAR
jgi:ABC-2 type transport system permease protein